MYRTLAEKERLSFGDVIEAPWLFDLYLREDSGALGPVTMKGGVPGWVKLLEPPATEPAGRRDHVLAAAGAGEAFDYVVANGHGRSRRGIILTDDCEMVTQFGRGGTAGDGRILLAAVRNATEEEADAAIAQELNFGVFGLRESGDMRPGVAVLEAVFSVHVSALAARGGEDTWSRLAALDEEHQRALGEKWMAHATRHGPLVVAAEGRKLAKLLTADGDESIALALDDPSSGAEVDPRAAEAAKLMRRASKAMWSLEGPILDEVADAWVAHAAAAPYRARVVEKLRKVRRSVDAALEALGEASWAPGDEQADDGGSPADPDGSRIEMKRPPHRPPP